MSEANAVSAGKITERLTHLLSVHFNTSRQKVFIITFTVQSSFASPVYILLRLRSSIIIGHSSVLIGQWLQCYDLSRWLLA